MIHERSATLRRWSLKNLADSRVRCLRPAACSSCSASNGPRWCSTRCTSTAERAGPASSRAACRDARRRCSRRRYARWSGTDSSIGRSIGCPAHGRILPDAHGPALHPADRDALCLGGQQRRRVVEAQEKAEEADGFETQLINDGGTHRDWASERPDRLATRRCAA